MFTVGIFTTHIPYIAMIAFYAYFLLFGVSRANEGKVEITEKSNLVQIHIDNSIETIADDTYCFYTSFEHVNEAFVFERNTVKQKWKHCCVSKIILQDHSGNSILSRPPPELA